MIPPVQQPVPTALTIAELLGTGGPTAGVPPIAAQVIGSTPTTSPTAQVNQNNTTSTVCVYCENNCPPGECLGQLFDAVNNTTQHMCHSFMMGMQNKGVRLIGSPLYRLSKHQQSLPHAECWAIE